VTALFVLCGIAPPAPALNRLDFTVAGADEDLTKTLRGASLVIAQRNEGLTDAQDLFAAARADYARLLGALYAEGHYSAVIRIAIDGREVADIAPLNAPSQIDLISVQIDPGPRFAFSQTDIAPLTRKTELPPEFRVGEPARAGVVEDVVGASILGWREEGHAKARVAKDDLVADHRNATLAASILLDPGPALRFGTVTVTGADRMRVKQIIRIAGLKAGEEFSQTELNRAANRLRRTGVFSSVTLSESETIEQGGLLPIEIALTEQERRHYSVGVEIASVDGLSLTGEWIHRNLWGGAERLEFDAAISNIGSDISGMDYLLGISLDRPATFSADTTASVITEFGHLDEVDYTADYAEFGLSFVNYFSDSLTLRAGLTYNYIEGNDPGGSFRFRNVSLPIGATWDRRDSTTDARKGFYIDAEVKPFLGLGTTDSGVRVTFDTRAFRSFGDEQGVTLALRVQGGAVLGSDLLNTPRDDLFFSGGGGTVRGQPYRSLGVAVTRGAGPSFLIGGTHMLAGSVELRTRITDMIGVVGFVDAGRVDVDGFFNDLGDWHAGAGLGLRYETGFGPIRFDIAAPVHGDTGDGVQIYIGLGQSF
jgi:translocation and assembly module TamA